MTGPISEAIPGDAACEERMLDRRRQFFFPLWRTIGKQLRHPSGLVGALIAGMMTYLNKTPYRLAIDALQVESGDRVLELGFGPGSGLSELVARANEGHVHGVDFSPQMVAMAFRSNFAAVLSGRLTIEQGTFDSVAASDGAFNKILLVNTLYFVDPLGRDMQEVWRLLESGGRVSAFVTDSKTMNKWPFARPDTHRTFSRGELRELFVAAGFSPERIDIDAVELPAGIHGLVAICTK